VSKRFLRAKVLDQADQRVQSSRREDAGVLFVHLAVSDTGDILGVKPPQGAGYDIGCYEALTEPRP
jgi:hypothetical protein